MVKIIPLFIALAISATTTAQSDALLDAIRRVETGGCKNPATAVGDNGKAIGPYQIHRVYWQDAVDHDPSLGGTYADCKNEKYARRVVRTYMSRYAPKGASDEQYARIHNGGGGILKKQHSTKEKDKKAWANTTAYWAKVRKQLN
jgi:hypothetical protein